MNDCQEFEAALDAAFGQGHKLVIDYTAVDLGLYYAEHPHKVFEVRYNVDQDQFYLWWIWRDVVFRGSSLTEVVETARTELQVTLRSLEKKE